MESKCSNPSSGYSAKAAPVSRDVHAWLPVVATAPFGHFRLLPQNEHYLLPAPPRQPANRHRNKPSACVFSGETRKVTSRAAKGYM